MSIMPKSAYDIKIPEMIPVTQRFPDERMTADEMRSAIRRGIVCDMYRKKIRPGMKVAVLVGSRGINSLTAIVRATVDGLKELGAEPFLVPAMGSHGGGVAEEQKNILVGYGLTEESTGASIVSSMETDVIGATKNGVPVHFDHNAHMADAVVPVCRVKVHTDFDGPIESGICKMLAIGGGKHNGCSRLHREGFDKFPELIPEVGSVILEKINVVFSVAIVENAHEHVNLVEVVDRDSVFQREPELLKLSRSLMPKLQFDQIDVLVVKQIGKDITGAGMDPNITGKRSVGRIPDFRPYIKRILVLGLSEGTHRNGTGVGVADFITRDVFDTIDLRSTYTNCIASGNPEAGRLPIVVENEEEGIRAAIMNCSGVDPANAKIVRIYDTLHLIDIEVSKNMLCLCADKTRFEIKR
ncbi:lactate racemase domain-containing protein [Hornefia butyriciproducens]|uniref:lactate racemase domain-containing protein n=1 Tax=Hornefia butyriciproducens TaxID=2652293 RepID=UPI002A9133C4|nr:lactate racemase domain-containing protein [Hornefia butyriciproducens]MDY5423478.1 lactate racemase domain-containing protein [Hornefia butyriciproducens]